MARQYGSDKQAPGLTPGVSASAQEVENFHGNDDLDSRPESHHHTLGASPNQASPGDHTHQDGKSSPLLLGTTISGSRGGNVALAGVIAALVALGATDSTTP